MSFKPGVSGNENGRPRNTGHRQKLFNSLVLPHKDALIAKAIDMALEGNEGMLKLFLERILPAKPSGESINFNLEGIDMTNPESILGIGERILEDVLDDNITPAQAKHLFNLMQLQCRNIMIMRNIL
jgi:hypothetical protein